MNTTVIVRCGTRARHTEQWGGFTLQRESPVRRVKTEPRSASPGVGEVRLSIRTSLRIARKCTVLSVLLITRLVHPWPNVLLYAFPPLCLITPTLIRVWEQRLSLILMAPYWPSRPWMAELTQLIHGQPWLLPLSMDLMSQTHGQIFHPHPERLAFWAWYVRG